MEEKGEEGRRRRQQQQQKSKEALAEVLHGLRESTGGGEDGGGMSSQTGSFISGASGSETGGEDAVHMGFLGSERSSTYDGDAGLSGEVFGSPRAITNGENDVDEEDNGDDGGALGSFSLGELDISTQRVSLEGLDEELERFKDHEMVMSILNQEGGDMKEYAKEVDRQLRQVELESIQDYIAESANLVELQSEIEDCDGILASMETLLGGFQSDLANISSEIRTLQEQSMSMSVKLRNRKAAEALLGDFVENISVPPSLIEEIVEEDISETYVESLKLLHEKLQFAKRDKLARQSKALLDVEPELEKLRIKAVAKIKEYVVLRIGQMRRPRTNFEMIQRNVLMKYSPLIFFLKQHGPEVYPEVREYYVESMSKVIASRMKQYISDMSKVQMEIAGYNDLIGGTKDDSKAGVLGIGSLIGRAAAVATGGSSSSGPVKSSVFGLGKRVDVLDAVDSPALVAHTVEGKLPYEVIFRSLNRLLMDTATTEYSFVMSFFKDRRMFGEIFAATIAAVEESLQATVSECYDALALLLMIFITYRTQLLMQQRQIPAMDDYLDKLNILLWPRLKIVLDMHIKSVRKAGDRTFWSSDAGPTLVTRRFAEFAASMLQLYGKNKLENSDTQLMHMLERLYLSVTDIHVRMARHYPARDVQLVFLINNHDLAATVIREATGGQQEEGSEYADGEGWEKVGMPRPILLQLNDAIARDTSLFVEAELGRHFSQLIAFVKKAETAQKEMGADATEVAPGFGADDAAPVVRNFSGTWKTAVNTMYRGVSRRFTNMVRGVEVMKAAMTQMLLYYTKLQDHLGLCGDAGAAVLKEAVTIPEIMLEIKRLSKTGGRD